MKFFTYIVARDYGFAPNPYYNYCTLATCKPDIRKAAKLGDWILGTGAAKTNTAGKLVFIMEVTEKLTFDEYWNDVRFQCKKPRMNGSIKEMYGDNIYHKSAIGGWVQENSHHTHGDGSTNLKNLNKDTKADSVLISNNFYYFGGSCIDIPNAIKNQVCMSTQGFKYADDVSAKLLIKNVQSVFAQNYHRKPMKITNGFERFAG